ncbi:MAG: ABC transporter ATP-binding protein/permease [Rhabdaerophilum sp.]
MLAFQPNRTLALAIAAISALGIILNLTGALNLFGVYVPIGGLALAIAILATPGIGAFLNFFIVFYGLAYIGLMAILILGGFLKTGWVTMIPPLTAFTSAAFGLLAILLARIPVTRGVFRIADPYFETQDKGTLKLWPLKAFTARERWIAYVLLGIIIVINLAQVGITVRLNQWNREFYDAIQNKNQPEFWRQLSQIWVPIVAVFIVSNIIELVLISVFKIRWREWMTNRLTARWLDGGTHYRLQFAGGIDNPDQRISEDVRKYVDTTYALTIQMISQISSLVSFSVILWGLSANLPLPGTETKIPGMLFWIALLYAGIGTFIAHMIGRRLIPLNFDQEKYEANFRYMLARLREYNEPVALLKGEPVEKAGLAKRFGPVARNYLEIIGVQKWLGAFTSFYGMANSVIPILITAPFYFAGQLTLGVMMQTASAFSRVDAALAFFIDRYATLADYKAVVDRLTGFDATIDTVNATRTDTRIHSSSNGDANLHIPSLALTLPNGQPMLTAHNLTLRAGERTLLTGPSGSGKSTLFRAIAGIWPFGEGQIAKPNAGEIMLLPQRPYIPIGTLRAAVSYPASDGDFSEEAMKAALMAVHLPNLAARLDEEANWSQMLSGGEQQRLAVARAILAQPGWLFLDEATSALDEGLEASVYAAIRTSLPGTTIVSIGHRSSLIAIHDRRIDLRKDQNGLFRPEEAVPQPA